MNSVPVFSSTDTGVGERTTYIGADFEGIGYGWRLPGRCGREYTDVKNLSESVAGATDNWLAVMKMA